MPPLGFSWRRAAVVHSPQQAGRLREELRQLRGGSAGGRGFPTPAGQGFPDPAPKPRCPEPLGVDPQNRVSKHPTGSANTHTEPAPRGALTHGASPTSSPALENEKRTGGGTGK